MLELSGAPLPLPACLRMDRVCRCSHVSLLWANLLVRSCDVAEPVTMITLGVANPAGKNIAITHSHFHQNYRTEDGRWEMEFTFRAVRYILRRLVRLTATIFIPHLNSRNIAEEIRPAFVTPRPTVDT